MLFKSFISHTLFLSTFVYSSPVELHRRQAPSTVPDYVLKYAPIVYLYSGEEYFPTDLQGFLDHTTPQVNFAAVAGPSPLTTSNVNQLGSDVFLTSNDDVTQNPEWLKGTKPDANGKTNGAISTAVIVNDKGNSMVDVFYMYFYAYNYGGNVLGLSELNFGNHVGDWEHTMVRFSQGVPQAMWYSQHSNGEAFEWSVVEKQGDRPVAYSATGTHANYAISGAHDHTIPDVNLPGGVLEDHTDKGTMWDPVLSAWFYTFDNATQAFAAYDASTPTGWLNFKGRWGDEQYPTSDKRQVVLFGQPKFASGPTGPFDKQLERDQMCPVNGDMCILRTILVPK